MSTASFEISRMIHETQGNEAVAGIDSAALFAIKGKNVRFRKLLVANRGEIAVRIMRACSELGILSVAIYAKEDALALHRFRADEAYLVGEGKAPLRAYMDIDDIMRICRECGADALHPGYGFLSENPALAQACLDNKITFVGPRPDVIASLGDKTAARDIANAANVPIVPGTNGFCESYQQACRFAETHGLPVLIKAAFGGGGRGMRVVREMTQLEESLASAAREAESAFGNGAVFLEKYLDRPKHIEIQILGDQHGNVMHLFERDCSVQRRHQKLVEMAPSPSLSQNIRQGLYDAAVRIAKQVNYTNAGTVEFLVDKSGFYFIEVNPRIQVEHTVTEEITGVDLVKSQICIASGMSLQDLDLSQETLTYHGSAIQVRITTEDPKRGFRPDTGKLQVYRSPGGPGIRLDSATTAGTYISPHFDSLLVKMTAHGRNHHETVLKLMRAVTEFRVRGVKTNLQFLRKVLVNEDFRAGNCWTTFVDDTPSLFEFKQVASRTEKLLRYLGNLVVNGAEHEASLLPDKGIVADVPPLSLFTSDPSTPPGGWRQIFLEKGAAAFAKAVRAHKGGLVMDTTWRDAHQSLLATRVRTLDIREIAAATSYALQNCYSLECWGGATFDVALRFLHECPWARLKTLRALVPNIPFQMLLRGSNAVGYTAYPDNVVYDFVAKAKDSGIDVFRVFDSLNYIPNLEIGIKAVHAAGGIVEGAVCYTGDVSDPAKKKYDLAYYMGKVDELVKLNIHVLCIKDMAGLLKPKAATMLISAIRRKYPELPIHIHTHDTAGTGVASMLACLEAGADVVDGAIDSLSGLTSQPSLGAIIGSLQGTQFDTGLDPAKLQLLNDYWEQAREFYKPFESPNLKSVSSDVYVHEMPGGQFTNLQFQAHSLGLSGQWPAIKHAYAEANELCGDIVKVTPSSKVVGDLAQFMVQNKLDKEKVMQQAKTLDFPRSVVEYFQGFLGQPDGGFPEPLRTDIIRDSPRINIRPGEDMPPLDFDALRKQLQTEFPDYTFSDLDLSSAALYPSVFREYVNFQITYGDVSYVPTVYFLRPFDIDEEVEFVVGKGKEQLVRLLALGRLLKDGTREVFWEVNGRPRVVPVKDNNIAKVASTSERPKATQSPGSIGAPMSGVIVEVRTAVGEEVTPGSTLLVLSAMKMETVVTSPIAGIVRAIHVAALTQVEANDLLVTIDPK